MGTSVATELFARDIAGELGFEAIGALLFNGSMILELSSPPSASGCFAAASGRSPRGSPRSASSRPSSARSSPREHPLTDAEEADQWSLITHNGGHHIGHRLVRYMDEREIYAERWHGAIRDWARPLRFAWGMLDPVATPDVLGGLRELRPGAEVKEFADLGHYPQLEDPPRLTAAMSEAIAASEGS